MKFHATTSNVTVLGRTIYEEDTRYLGYSCSGIAFKIKTKKVTARLWSDGALYPGLHKAWVAVFINGEEVPRKRFVLEAEEAMYCLFESEQEETIELRLVKYSEDAFATVGIKELISEGVEVPQPISLPKRKLLFIGDSITCGYGNEGEDGKDSFCTDQENPWDAYAARTARYLGCDYHLMSWSGIGIISSYTEEDVPLEDPLMPKLYPYTDPGLMRRYGERFAIKWEKTAYNPDCIIVNLGTNDESYTKEHPDRIACFGRAYYAFLKEIRKDYPESQIICMLGVMGDILYPEIERQVEGFKKQEKDDKIIACLFPVQKAEDGIGADWHPSKKTHEKVANKLCEVIKSTMKW